MLGKSRRVYIYLYRLHRESIYSKQSPTPTSKPVADGLFCMKRKKRGRAEIRTRVQHPSFMFNQPADGLIGMLMRLARCLLDQFDLKDTTLAFQLRIREQRKSPIPVRRTPVAPDCAAGAHFNQRQSRACRQTPEEHVRTNTGPSHIIKSTFGPNGFYC